MFINGVDEALHALLRARLPMADGDISFDAPTPDWAARLTRPTISLFLRRVDRSTQSPRAPQRRFDANGRPERRGAPAQMIELDYVATVWAPDAATEHRLLGSLVSLVAATPAVPAQYVPATLAAPVQLGLGAEQHGADTGFGPAGPLKAYALISVTVAADHVDSDEPAPAGAAGTA